jgi:pyridoxamine 5'-phosphate oxidase
VEISKNPYVAVTLHWKELGRQVRITGKVKQVSRLESETYFNTRPLESRINAVISPQSQVIPDRHFLEKRRMELVSSPGIENIRRPEEWGGYRIIPSTFEFWQEMAFRLHDRILYSKKNGKWIIQRLAP